MLKKSILISILFLISWLLALWQPNLTPLRSAEAAMPQVCWLAAVVDGDTLRVTCQGKPVTVRLHCIDAPEMEQNPWGENARQALQRLAPRLLQLKVIELDRYGRTVAEVFTASSDHRSLNLELVKNGNAAVYARYCDDSRFTQAQKIAKKAKLGIWSRGGLQQTPWTFRHRQKN